MKRSPVWSAARPGTPPTSIGCSGAKAVATPPVPAPQVAVIPPVVASPPVVAVPPVPGAGVGEGGALVRRGGDEELKLAQQALAELTGERLPDDLLGEIFASFCIGK